MDLKAIARGRARKLLELARAQHAESQKLARRYVSLARKIAMKHRFPLGSKDFCRKCGTIWIAGVTVVIRTNPRERAVRYTCKTCGVVRRFGYGREKLAKKKRA